MQHCAKQIAKQMMFLLGHALPSTKKAKVYASISPETPFPIRNEKDDVCKCSGQKQIAMTQRHSQSRTKSECREAKAKDSGMRD